MATDLVPASMPERVAALESRVAHLTDIAKTNGASCIELRAANKELRATNEELKAANLARMDSIESLSRELAAQRAFHYSLGEMLIANAQGTYTDTYADTTPDSAGASETFTRKKRKKDTYPRDEEEEENNDVDTRARAKKR